MYTEHKAKQLQTFTVSQVTKEIPVPHK